MRQFEKTLIKGSFQRLEYSIRTPEGDVGHCARIEGGGRGGRRLLEPEDRESEWRGLLYRNRDLSSREVTRGSQPMGTPQRGSPVSIYLDISLQPFVDAPS